MPLNNLWHCMLRLCIDLPPMNCHDPYTAASLPTIANEWSTYLNGYGSTQVCFVLIWVRETLQWCLRWKGHPNHHCVNWFWKCHSRVTATFIFFAFRAGHAASERYFYDWSCCAFKTWCKLFLFPTTTTAATARTKTDLKLRNPTLMCIRTSVTRLGDFESRWL